MAVVVIKQPQRDIKTKKSKWNAVHQSITFEFQRQDFKVIKAIPSKYFANLKFNPCTDLYFDGLLPTVLKVNQNITYIVNGVKYTAKVITIKSKVLVIEKISNNTLNGGFLLLKDSYSSYYLEVNIYAVDATNTFEFIGTTKVTDNDKGEIKVNVQEWLQTKCIFRNDFKYDVLNQKQIGEGSQFNITWREVFDGKETNPFTILSNVNLFYWVNATKQVQESYSENMADYVPTIDNTRTDKAKFQSVFKKPTYFVGYPFSLNFIYSDNLENIEIRKREVTKNLNGTQIASTTDLLNMNSRGYSNRLMLKQGYTSSVKTIDVWLESNTVTTWSPVHWDEEYSELVFLPFEIFSPVTMPFVFRGPYNRE
jgi:hypothetical protein